MERRFAVLAGFTRQALSGRRQPRSAWPRLARLCVAVVALAAMASPADARPKRKDARVAFDRGVAAYKKGNYTAASDALKKSYTLENDVETLFAWAQSERKLEHCDAAIELYEQLLTLELSPTNREAVNGQLSECKAQLAAERKVEPPATEPAAAPVNTPSTPSGASEPPVVAERAGPSEPSRSDTGSGGRSWYRNPIVLGLTGSGLIAIGVGGGFLFSAQQADGDVEHAKDYVAAQDFVDTAKSREKIGLISMGVGGALVVGGVVWAIVTRSSTDSRAMTGWLAPGGGGGLALAGSF